MDERECDTCHQMFTGGVGNTCRDCLAKERARDKDMSVGDQG